MAVDAVTQGLFKDAQLSNPIILVSSAAPVVNSDYTNYLDITAQAVAINFANANLTGTPADGQTLTIRLLDNGSARAITWGTNFVDYRGAGTPLMPTTTIAGKRMTVSLRWDSTATKWGMTGLTQE